MVFDIFTLVEVVWILIPVYTANGLAPVFKGRHPIDFGKTLRKMPVLGEGKTWEGLIGGVVVGGIIGIVEQLAYPFLPFSISPVHLAIIPMSMGFGLVLGFGALFGDLCGAFVKRRCGMQRGQPAPLLDQEDFIIGAFFVASFFAALKPEWFVLAFVITPAIHVVANFVGFLLKVKKEPW